MTKLIKDPNFYSHEDIPIEDLCDTCKLHHWDNSINPERTCSGKYNKTTDKVVKIDSIAYLEMEYLKIEESNYQRYPDNYHTPQSNEICPEYQHQLQKHRDEEESDPERCNPILLQNKEIYRQVFRRVRPDYTGGTPVEIDKSFLPQLEEFIVETTSLFTTAETKDYTQPATPGKARVEFFGYSNSEVIQLANKLKNLLQTFKDDTILLLLD